MYLMGPVTITGLWFGIKEGVIKPTTTTTTNGNGTGGEVLVSHTQIGGTTIINHLRTRDIHIHLFTLSNMRTRDTLCRVALDGKIRVLSPTTLIEIIIPFLSSVPVSCPN